MGYNLTELFLFFYLVYFKVWKPIYIHLNVDSAILNCKAGISRSFCNSRQEDAHELMVSLLESMHKCSLPSGIPSESPSAYEKSLVHRIFGGRLRSQVHCVNCIITFVRVISNKAIFIIWSLDDLYIYIAGEMYKVLTLFKQIWSFPGSQSWNRQCYHIDESTL